MRKMSSAVVLSLVAGFAAAALVLQAGRPVREPVPTAPQSYFDETAATEDRIRALEAAVSAERQARQLLEEELLLLFADVERLQGRQQRAASVDEARGGIDLEATERVREFRGTRSSQATADALVDEGLTPERAAWILQREEELRYESMQARFAARNSSNPQDMFNANLNPEAMLRAEIGDAQYEMYLRANGRPTSVAISAVLSSSPAAHAGLQPGDEITAYDGQRVFHIGDLVQRTMSGGDTGTVVVDVMRDGAPMQVVVPRGPIGVEVGRRWPR